MTVGAFQVGPFQPAYQQSVGVAVPDVVGTLQADGTSTLEGDGFVVVVQTEYSSTVAAGLVTRQEPTGGTLASLGSSVTIWVSLGVEPQSASGGWEFAFRWEQEQIRRRRKRKKLEELEEERERIADAQAREIALLLQEQERKDARREELARLSRLVETYSAAKTDSQLSQRVRKAIETAIAKQTTWALAALDRELRRAAKEEEDFVFQALRIALQDD